MKPFHYALVIVAALGGFAANRGTGSRTPQAPVSGIVGRATDGAYRDGLFMGQMDRNKAKPRHVASARWNSDADRQSFRQGYEQGYTNAAQ